MKVIHVLRDLQAGGAESVCVALSNWLAEQGHDVWLVSRSGPLRARLSPAVTWVETRGGATPAPDFLTLLRLAVRIRPDVLHTHQRREAVLARVVSRAIGCRSVEHAHTLLPSRKLKCLSFRSQHVFAVGDAVKDMVVTDFGRPPQNVSVVGNVPAAAAVDDACPRDADLSSPMLLGVGRLDEQKDPCRFVRVVAAVSRLQPETRADWYGEGPLRAETGAEIQATNSPAQLRGLSDRIADELDGHDALILTSRWEGRPLVILEAMARMRPVIAPDIDGVRELLQGGRGVLVPAATDDETYAKTVVDVLSDPDGVRAMVRAAHRFVTENGTPEKVFGHVSKTYEEVLENQ